MRETKRVLFLGDSLIEFFNWQKNFKDMSVLNRGRAGETVRELLDRLADEVSRAGKVDVVIIMIGANNLAGEDYAFMRDYEEILCRLRRAYPMARIGACSLLPFHFPWLAADTIVRMNASLQSITLLADADYLDVYAAFIVASEAGQISFLPDGVHLSAKGYETWKAVLKDYF